jgi:hypothetical protein
MNSYRKLLPERCKLQDDRWWLLKYSEGSRDNGHFEKEIYVNTKRNLKTEALIVDLVSILI